MHGLSGLYIYKEYLKDIIAGKIFVISDLYEEKCNYGGEVFGKQVKIR